MLPTVLSHELMEGVEAFLRSTFPTSTPAFQKSFDEILNGAGRNKLFQGPYLRVGLPFQNGTAGRNYFSRLETDFPPYFHQEKAWKRLQTTSAKSTLVATGTGSGKTECFMYPILDHILANPGQRGIKAIILYPMNALASDQARRFAKEVHTNSACKGKVRVGLYVGGLQDGGGSRQMTENEVITSREEMRASPPDILMTNYKMLDYLLIRQDDRNLWSENTIETLRYLVVDELHTFDGAQGSDLACLIRRVKARVKMEEDHLCCIGTSATLGTEDGIGGMIDFAQMIFGEPFEENAVITEKRKSTVEHIENGNTDAQEILYFEPPGPEHHEAMSPSSYHSIESFVEAQTSLWFGEKQLLSSLEEKVELANKLRRHNFLRTFLSYFKADVLAEEEILADLKKRRASWDIEHHKLLINSFTSLCCVARNDVNKAAYFLQIRSELWMRELSRMVASVSLNPAIRFSMDLPADHPQKHLAAIHCRDCGVMGWAGVQKTNETQLIPELDRFYSAFFSVNPDPRLCFVFPVSGIVKGTESLLDHYLCGSCLTLFDSKDGKCEQCGTIPHDARESAETITIGTFKVESHLRTIQRPDKRVADKSCPYCESSTGLTIVGSRAASLTSVGLSQLFGSPYNDDKKAMAFSDSVQDASHRAGFFTARTYPITMRTALCQVIDQEVVEPSLSSLSKRFPAYWLEKFGKKDFVGTFIPPTIEWDSEFESFTEEHKLSSSSQLPEKVTDGLQWEVIREFGMQCRIGRTLEKSGAAACHLNTLPLTKASASLIKDIHDLGSSFKSINEHDCRRLITAICERLRINGGISHMFIESYIEKRGDAWVFNNKIAGGSLPRIAKPGIKRRPTFFASFSMKDSFERLLASGATPTWTERWVEKWLNNIVGDRSEDFSMTPLIEAMVKALIDVGLWQKHKVIQKDHGNAYAYSLNPENLMISTEVANHVCKICGHHVTSSASAEEQWKDTPCLRHKCKGHYKLSISSQRSFFGNLYRSGDVVRLRSAEHTGMLTRSAREEIESEFMREPSLTTDANLLSCTPTMEMGVDVGDLSTVLLCSVPPEQSNYIQRAGRGGRRDGNSLAMTVATSAAHDLTYYEEPLKMLAGDVQMPAIFLRAPAVLERQLTAYCVDRWIESVPSASIPRTMESIYIQLSSETKAKENKGAFPLALYEFIKLNLTDLAEGFEGMFKRKELDEESLEYLQIFIAGNNEDEGSLSFKINNALAAANKDREGLYNKRKKLTKAIAANKKKVTRDEKLDKEQNNMLAERKGISRLIKDVNNKQTLNFLTDEGLLPNYAFPEEGVTMHSIILKKPGTSQDGGKLIKLEFEHIRPAEAAITELAPGNSFYVEGRKLTIDRVSIEDDDYEEWHFCKSCSHLEPVSTQSEQYAECPKCHCDGWKDASLKQKMLKMRQVFVTAWDENVRNLDQEENRGLTAFNKQTSIDFEKEAVRKSYSLRAEGATFAFDFIDEITLREVNLGEDRNDAQSIEIGGKHLHGIAFVVCKDCGKLQGKRIKEDKKHDISCSHFGTAGGEEEFENTVLLYRQLQSEAIKLLIPSLNQDENIDTQSFVAAIHLGLKEKFGGHLTHLKLSVQHQPISGSKLKSQHVYIYDSVPGGTGYLKDLTRNENSLLEIIEKSYHALRDCTCSDDPELDGCYQCIKAYRFRFVNNQISRETALRQLKRILDHKDSIEERSPGETQLNPLLESELERRFIEALKQKKDFVVNPEIVDGRPGYLLKVFSAAWKIIPQVDLGPDQGVSISCRPDFILQPLRPSKGLPIAVFLDGFAYHANVELDNNRIADDIAKRNAIRMSDRYLVWSLTWSDIAEQAPSLVDPFLGPAFNDLSRILKDQASELADLPIFASPDWSSWDLLLEVLKHLAKSEATKPLDQWQSAASLLACNFPAPARVSTDEDSLRSVIEGLLLGQHPKVENSMSPEFMSVHKSDAALRLVSAIPIASLKEKRLDGALSALWFDDAGDKPAAEFKPEWQELLRVFNILQFVPRFACLTKLMVEKGGISNIIDWLLHIRKPDAVEADTDKLSEDQLDELKLLDETIQPVLVPLLKDQTLSWPEFGYESTTPSGQCGASMLEVAWPKRKIGIALDADNTSDFETLGWKILSAPTLNSNQLKEALDNNN